MDGPPLTVMIPLGGLGTRFMREGYSRPKPFVAVMGKPMILWVLDSLALREDDELVIVYNPDLISKKFWPIVTAAYPRLRFVTLPGPTRGAAETVLIGLRGLPSSLRARPVMLVDGDAFYDQDVVSMYRAVADAANGVFFFEDTQPRPMYSYIVFDPSSRRISQVKEKVKISDHANSGCYCFRSGHELDQQCQALLDAGSTQLSQDKVGEYYTSGVIAAMIEEGHAFEALQIDPSRFHVLGTPAQLVAFCCRRAEQRVARVCFDLDNTLVTSPRVQGDYRTCEPIEANIAACRALHEQGHHILILCSRGMEAHRGNVGAGIAAAGQSTLDTLAQHRIPYHELHLGKPHADFYIDDDAVSSYSDVHKETGLYIGAPRATADGKSGSRKEQPCLARPPFRSAAPAPLLPLRSLLVVAAASVGVGVLIGVRIRRLP